MNIWSSFAWSEITVWKFKDRYLTLFLDDRTKVEKTFWDQATLTSKQVYFKCRLGIKLELVRYEPLDCLANIE